jgi:outer membrane protein
MKKILTLLLTVNGMATTQAQVNPELNKWILQSFNYYPRIQELNKSAEISEVRVDLAKSNYLPNVNGTASYNYVNPLSQTTIPISATETRTLLFQPHNNYNLNVGISHNIWDFGKTKAQVEKAKADLLVSKINIESAKLQLASQVTGIYYSLIYLKKAMEVQDTVISFYEKNRTIIEGKLKQGDALQVDLSNILNTMDQEKNRKVDFQRQYERQLALLNYTAGTAQAPQSGEFDFQGSGSRELNADTNPDIIAANQRITSAQADLKYVNNNRLPSLALNANAGGKNGYQPNLDEIRFNYLAGVTLSVPIFQGHRLRDNIAISQKSVELGEITKTNTNNTLQKDWQSAMADLNAYETQLKNSESQITASMEALRLTQVRYENGVATYLDLIFASSNLQRALLTQLQYKYQATLSLAELSRLQGIKFWQE